MDKIAKELLKLANELITFDYQDVETEHDKIKKLINDCAKNYYKNHIHVYIDLQSTLLDKLDYNNLTIGNVNAIIVKIDSFPYELDKLSGILIQINEYVENIKNKIKKDFNKNIDIKVIF